VRVFFTNFGWCGTIAGDLPGQPKTELGQVQETTTDRENADTGNRRHDDYTSWRRDFRIATSSNKMMKQQTASHQQQHRSSGKNIFRFAFRR